MPSKRMARSTTRALRSAVPPLATLVVVGAAWEAAVRLLAVPAFLVPRPSAIAAALVAQRSMLLASTLTTAQGALAGFALSLSIGTLAGLLLSLSRTLERALYPYALVLQTVPIVAIAPLLVLWFGAGLRAVSVSAFIVSVFPVIASNLAGMRSADPRLADLFRLYGARLGATVFKLRLPSAIPSMATGWRVASGLAVIGAIVGEFVAGFSEGRAGLGITVLAAYRQLQTDLLFAAVLLAALLGFALFSAVSLAGSLLLRRLRAHG